jgi:OOP family OmpA-OmpF porin
MDALYHFRPDKRLVPYIAAGVGDRRLELDCGEKEDKFFLNYGGGIKYDITKKFSLRGDVRHIFSVDDSYNNMSVTVGLTYTIGGKEKKKLVVQQKAVPVYIPKPIIKKMKSINLNIQFDFDDATVKPQYHDHIKSVADSLIMNPNATAVIEGHTCAIGTDEYNIQLSQERANNVMKYMIKHFNIDPSRLKAIGYGRSRPIFDNDFEESRQKNRRVNAVITNE